MVRGIADSALVCHARSSRFDPEDRNISYKNIITYISTHVSTHLNIINYEYKSIQSCQ